MLDKIIPLKLKYYLELIRFYNPIGFMLLLWPCWFALALININTIALLKWYLIFFVGAFLMRSAGCIINDLVDIKIDRKILRTSERVLASKKVTIFEALIFLTILLLLSLTILLQFNYLSIAIGLLSFPIIILYPFMKRLIYWPQIILGIIFNWGIIIVSFQFSEEFNINFILLYIGCIFWTLAYDTIYAYQDIKDDIENGIKSTAVLFKNTGLIWVKIFYFIFFLFIGYLSWKTSDNLYSLIVIITAIFVINIVLNKWNLNSVLFYIFINFLNL